MTAEHPRPYRHRNPAAPNSPGLPTALTEQGIGLTGPGAEDAARALLVATLTAAGPDDPDLAADTSSPRTPSWPASSTPLRLAVRPSYRDSSPPTHSTTSWRAPTTTWRPAESSSTTRTRADLTAYRADPNNEPIPPAVVITEPLDDDQTARLSPPPRPGIHSTSPSSSSAPAHRHHPRRRRGRNHDRHDRPADDADSRKLAPRLAVLDQNAARELLDVLIEASTGQLPVDVPGSRGARTFRGLGG